MRNRPSANAIALRPSAAVDAQPAAHLDTAAIIERNLEEHRHSARGVYSKATEQALRSDSAVFSAWCSSRNMVALPADPETVAAFIDDQGLTKKPATIRRYVSSISHLHRAADVPNPCERKAVTYALRRVSKAQGTAQKQARGLDRNEVRMMLEAAGDRLQDLRNKALLSIAYDTLARRAELVALRTEDFCITRLGTGTATIRRSKTDQMGEGMSRHVARDTVQHLSAWIRAAGLTEGELFRSVLKGGRVGGALDVKEVTRIYRRMAAAAGLDEAVVDRISAHSTRIGAAKDMVEANLNLPSIMQSGGWKSPEMVARYTRELEAANSGSAQLATKQEEQGRR